MKDLICLDDTGRPSDIPLTKWIKKGEKYTLAGWIKCNAHGGRIALIVEEIDLKPYAPYLGFDSNRFGVIGPELSEVEYEEMVKPERIPQAA